MKSLEGLSVLILGLGDSGLAMARWCARLGARVTVADSREDPPQAHTLRRQLPQVQLKHGFGRELLDGMALVLKSPGLSPLAPELHDILHHAQALNIPVQGELYLFAQALAELKAERDYAPAVLAITGTNGKTTTTSLTAQLVQGAGKRVGVAGNIGPTLLDTLSAALDEETWPPRPSRTAGVDATPAQPSVSAEPAPEAGEVAAPEASAAAPTDEDEAPLVLHTPPPPPAVFSHLPEVWVLELSSFQLEGVTNFEPTAAVVLNITQDHLDWHGSMEAYAQAKARIYGHHGVMVVNLDDPAVQALANTVAAEGVAAGQTTRFGKTITKMQARRVIRFGLCAPEHPGDFGWMHMGSMAWLVRAMESDPTVKLKKGESEDIIIQRLMPADALLIPGRHNVSNALAALALASTAGCPLAPMLHVLRDYRGEPHRVQHVATVNGISAYDDSKGTNVGATVAALAGLGPDLAPSKVVIILGGEGKGQDFSPLQEPVRLHARAVALIGKDAAALAQCLKDCAVPLVHHSNLEQATRWAFEQAQRGDAVLLSPACASLDMFRNYEHRADVFVQTVREIAADQGEVMP